MKKRIPFGWAGIDVGKRQHWIPLIDQSGTTVWSAKVINDEAAILDAVGSVLTRADEVVWVVDVTGTMAGWAGGGARSPSRGWPLGQTASPTWACSATVG